MRSGTRGRNTGPAGPGGRKRLPGRGLCRGGRGPGRGRLQHGDDRLPGDPHRPLLQGADRRDDLPADRQHRDQPGGHGVGRNPSGGIHRPGVRGVPEQLALPRDPEGVSGGARQARGRGDRHPGADPPHPAHRRHAGDPLHGDGGHGPSPRARPGLSRARRPGPGEGGDLPRALPLEGRRSPGNDCRLRVARRRRAGRRRVVVLDCGVKYNILRNLEQRGCEVLVLPATATGEEILALAARRRPPLQRSRRSGGAPLHRGDGPVDPGEGPDLRHLPRPPDPGAGGRAGGRRS